MANLLAGLSAQTATSLKANELQLNTLLQQLTANNNQLNQQHQVMMQQLALLTTNPQQATIGWTNYAPPLPHANLRARTSAARI
jgi:hypothetical protein